MVIKFSFCPCCKLLTRRDASPCNTDVVVPPTLIPPTSTSSNLREEYANAFRTDSFLHFWSLVLSLSPSSSSSSLLDPDQPTASHLLSLHLHLHPHHPHHHLLLSSFFSDTSNASLLCSLLLSNLHSLRLSYLSLKSSSTIPQTQLPNLSPNPLFTIIQESISDLLKTLESKTKQTKSKLKLISRLKKAAALILIAGVTASASVIGVYIALHAFLAVTIAMPGFFPRSRWLRRALAQLDAASRGAYILNRDLDTVSRLVDRLQDEVEHMMGLLRLCLEMAGDRRRLTPEVVRQLRMSDASFNQQLDELQEHLYLCFMTINKARSLVTKELSL